MNYIDPVEYSKLIKSFTQGSTKQTLVEGIEEKKELSAKQKKIAAAAPPEDKITGADFAAMKSKKQEGLHVGQPTAPTITTVEGKRDYTKLSVDERKQLKEYIESMKTIKQEIKKLMEKVGMSEGGDTTGLVMPEGEDDDINTAAEEDAAFDRMQAARDLAGEMGYDDDSEFDDLEDQERAYHSRMSGGYEG